jgi:hypothetical protein
MKMTHTWLKYSLICCLLSGTPQAVLCTDQQDTTGVFYENKTFNGFLDKAILYQHKADSLYTLAVEWRKEIRWEDVPAEQRNLQKMIAVAEDSIEIYREMAGIHFAYANGMLPFEKKRSPYLEKDTVLSGITVYQYKLTDDFLAQLDDIEQATASPQEQEANPSYIGINFRIYADSPYSDAQTFEYDYPLPAGVFYRIQLAVYKIRLDPDHFRGLAPITTEKIPGKNLIRYFVGKFFTYQDARQALEKVRAYGHEDAFIVGYYNGKKGSLRKLQELEKLP